MEEKSTIQEENEKLKRRLAEKEEILTAKELELNAVYRSKKWKLISQMADPYIKLKRVLKMKFLQSIPVNAKYVIKEFINKMRRKARQANSNEINYLENLYNKAYEQSESHINYKEHKYDFREEDVKLIAFYLPQFHPFPENDEFWGKGFTEWTNVSKAVPIFEGHFQPKLPGELGFYDTRIKEVLMRQMEIAKNYGIYGFCLHHYWFSGKSVMRVPYNQIMKHPDLDLPFCLNWANEPWTNRWDGFSKSRVLIEQKHTPEDDLAFINDIEPALKDNRYIRINGRPLFLIYRPKLFPDIQATINRWNKFCEAKKIGKLYMAVIQNTFDGLVDPKELGFDAAVEFPPHNLNLYLKRRIWLN